MTSLEIIFGIASIFGLFFSLGALIQARRASAAAREARDRIAIRALADEFELACAKADQLLDFLTHDRQPEATLRARELTMALSEIPYRRSPYLTEERKNELRIVRDNAGSISGILASGQQTPLPAEQRQTLIRHCQKIAITLRENLGTIKGEIDTGAKQ